MLSAVTLPSAGVFQVNIMGFPSSFPDMSPPQGLCTWSFLFRTVLSSDICTTCTFTLITSLTKATSLIPFLSIQNVNTWPLLPSTPRPLLILFFSTAFITGMPYVFVVCLFFFLLPPLRFKLLKGKKFCFVHFFTSSTGNSALHIIPS